MTKDKTLEEEKEEIISGDAEENIYSEAGREEMAEDDDELNDSDEGFMKGYEEGAKVAKCPVCGEILEDDFVEKDIDGEHYRFCSEEHAEKFAKERGHAEEISVGDIEADLERSSDELEDIEKDKKILKEIN